MAGVAGTFCSPYDVPLPSALRALYTSFAVDDDMLAVLMEVAPPVVGFHFGLPGADRITALK